MRQVKNIVSAVTVAIAVTVLAVGVNARQGDPDRVVPGGGITGAGWQGNVIDAGSLKQGRSINDSKFVAAGSTITINAGPNNIYWNPAHVANGDFTVKATFAESNHLKHSNHPHPYGLFIGGANLNTPKANLLYCSAYGNGTFIFRGFAPDATNGIFRLGGNRGTANEAIRKAGPEGTVTQDISISVRGGNVTCNINGTDVATYPVSEVVGAGKLASTNGIAGLRIGHNMDVVVTGFAITK
jgi:hypothetical protein